MSVQQPLTRTKRLLAAGWLPVLLLFVLGGSTAACGGSSTGGGGSAGGGSAGAGPGSGRTMGHVMPTAVEVDGAWAGRPSFVRNADARTQEAYAYAIARPDVVDWLPCYCGCVAMDHRNNGDCYMKPREAGMPLVFEEHASFCKVCVDIALQAKSMAAEGKTLLQIRAAIDREHGGLGPGTRTELPPG
jgi:hypothetical protein